MSDTSQGEGWWIASDGKWYPPHQHPDYRPPAEPPSPSPASEPVRPSPDRSGAAETVAIPAAGQPVTPTAPTPATPTYTGPAATAPDLGTAPPTQAYTPGAVPGQPPADPSYGLTTADASGSSKRGLLLGIGALVLVAGLGFLAFRFFTGSERAGGADTPEGAVAQLVASINERDAVGIVDVFDPDEIEAWIGSFTPAIETIENLETERTTADEVTEVYASIFESFDYTLSGAGGEDITYDVTSLDDNGRISRVRIQELDFELTVSDPDTALILGIDGSDPTAFDTGLVDGAQLQLRDDRAGLMARLLLPNEPTEEEFAPDAHLDLVTVQKDGKWYISVGYSVLNIADLGGAFEGQPRPDYGRAFELVDSQTGGSESPEAVVQDMFAALEELDYARLFEITDPLGTPYLHDYQPLIDAAVDQQERRDAAREAQIRVDDLTLGTSEWEGRTLVTTQSFSIGADGATVFLDVENWCATNEDEFGSDTVCLEDAIQEALFELDTDVLARDLIPEEAGVVVVERNGRWYFDPLGTLGFYVDQLAEASAEFSQDINDELANNPASGFGFFAAEGPIARRDMPAVSQAASGAAAVAMDLRDFDTLSGDFSEFHVAVARVATTEPGSFVTYNDVTLTGEDWVVVYQRSEVEGELPAIAATTDGALDVQLVEAQVTELGPDGFTGQLGQQGRPQVFTLGDVFGDTFSADVDVSVEGANAETVYGWQSTGVVYDSPFGGSFIGDGAFVVIHGEPGATFTITVDVFEPEPEPEPEPDPGPEPDTGGGDAFSTFDDPVATIFAPIPESAGYLFVDTQPGGFFDGCGGPDDPDVTSYLFEGPDADLIVLTIYDTPELAMEAFDELENIQSPCDAFQDIVVQDVTRIDDDDIVITWALSETPEQPVYEQYHRSLETIVVVTNDSLVELEEQREIVDGW